MQYSKVVPQKDVTATTPLAGTYQIPGDFASIGAAVAVLNYVGVSDDVTFELNASSYNEFMVAIGSYAGNSDYTVTVQPAAATAVTINFFSTATNGKGFAFTGAKNFTIDGLNTGGASLSLQWDAAQPFPTSDGFGSTVYITGGSENIAVKNADIKGRVNNAVWASQTEGRSAIFAFSPDGDPYENYGLTFDGLTISGASFGMKFLGQDALVGGGGISITNCNIGGAFGDPVLIGILGVYTYNVNFSNNVIDGTKYLVYYKTNATTEYEDEYAFNGGSFLTLLGQSTAMHWIAVDNGVFDNNVLQNVGIDAFGSGIISYGTRIYFLNLGLNIASTVKNNKITNITVDATSTSITGIRGPAGNVYHNSIRLVGDNTGGTSTCLNGVTTAYNNALSNEMTGSGASSRRGYTIGGTVDYNAVYASGGYFVAGLNGVNAALAGGHNINGVFGAVNFNADLTLNTAGPSSAENIGKSRVNVLDDFDGTARDTSAAGKRDAGAYEYSADFTTAYGPDVVASGFAAPPAGVPVGPPQPVKVTIKNNSATATSAFDVSVSIPDAVPFNATLNGVTLNPMESKTITVGTWNPSAPGTYTASASHNLAGDIATGNDATSKSITVSAPTALTTAKTFTFDTGLEGWTTSPIATNPALGEWQRSNSFTKLAGPYSGYSLVTTRPTDATKYTEGAYASSQGYSTTYPGANIVLSEWLDIDNIGAGTDLYLSFFHSIRTEWDWDRSWWEYTLDGSTWNHIGVLNDPNGLNWYNEDLYEEAQIDPDAFDYSTAQQYGLMTGEPTDWPSWVSNSDEVSPSGWVYSAIKMTAANYPGATRASAIRFRFVAFSDAVYGPANGGWAIDNISIGPDPTAFSGSSIIGQLFHDIDGNGVMDGADSAMTNRTVKLNRFGSNIATTTTDGSGMYSFDQTKVNLPAAYEVEVVLPGYGFTIPADAATTGKSTVSNTGDNDDDVVNFGAFFGSVSGKKFNDVNNNGSDDSEPGYSGWTIQARTTSCTGTVVGTATTDANGAYSIALPPGTYYIREVKQSGYRATTDTCVTITISGAEPTATVNFGNFKLGIIKFEALNDLDGDGIKDAGDVTALPSGAFVNFDVTKDGDPFASSVIGSQTASETFSDLDVGVYVFTQTSTPSGWEVTNPAASTTVTVATSGVNSTITRLHFKQPKVNGYVFDDTDGDGTWDGGEPALEGWDVVISGNGGGTFATDADGFYETYVGTGNHTISVANQTGWSQTTPVANAGTFVFSAVSGTVPGADQLNKNFGKFENITVSGTVYRDYNGDGAVNGADAPMSATVSLTGSSDQTGGTFSFTGVGGGAKTLSVTVPSGFTATTAASIAISPASGVNSTGNVFLLFQDSDGENTYRTFTLDTMQSHAARKAIARKAGNFPNLVNMLAEIFKQAKDSSLATGIEVGEAGNLLSNGKTVKGYVKPAKEGDVQASLYKKGKLGPLYQDGTASGLDFFTGGEKRITKLNKNLGPDKHDNVLFGNLMVLAVNIAASDFEKTPTGFGDLKYVGSYEAWDGMTVRQILADANDKMTNWEFVTASTFSDMNAAVASINAEFASTSLDTASFFAGGKLSWTGVMPVSQSDILIANPNAQPYQIPTEQHPPVPTAFALNQNYPNPFNPTTTISFELAEPAIVTVKVFNMLGQEVATVLDREEFFDGVYSETFDASGLTSGVYFYQILTDVTNEETGATQHFTQTKKMLLAK
ncbi:MAG: T9SS type A sorting domain-containing protein [Ignavibacteriae bacterium]|nr:T9SS type A sorting domain-containing protein [Ignavibacteriota bacterium]